MLNTILTNLLTRLLNRSIDKKTEEILTEKMAGRQQQNARVFTSGIYDVLQLKMVLKFFAVFLGIVIAGMLLAEEYLLAALMLLIFSVTAWLFHIQKSRQYIITYWENTVVLTDPEGEQLAYFTSYDLRQARVKRLAVHLFSDGRKYTIRCNEKENGPAFREFKEFFGL